MIALRMRMYAVKKWNAYLSTKDIPLFAYACLGGVNTTDYSLLSIQPPREELRESKRRHGIHQETDQEVEGVEKTMWQGYWEEEHKRGKQQLMRVLWTKLQERQRGVKQPNAQNRIHKAEKS